MREAEVGIDDAHQGQLLEVVAFGDELRADDQIEVAARDFDETIAQLLVAAHVGTEDHRARIGEARRGFFGDALDAGADSDQRVDFAALAAGFRLADFVAAMVAHEHAAETMLHQPGRAFRALILVAAGLAERQRRVAAAVEEQEGLLAAVDRSEDLARQVWSDPLALFRRLGAHVESGDIGQPGFGEARGEQNVTVTTKIGVVARFHRRGG